MRALLVEEDVAVSRLTEVEVVSALARLARERALTEMQRDAAVASLLKDLVDWDVVEVTGEVTARARGLLMAHPLRAGDAIQLASALTLQSQLGRPLDAFVSLDVRLTQAARRERLTVLEV